MILKKPYGFLIKHFKIIHLLLTGLYIYLAIKVNQLLTYYNNFILGTASKLDAIKYITNYYIIAIILSIVICLIIYALMRYKKKPRLLYFILIALYLLIGVVIQTSYRGLDTIYISVLDTKTLRLYRDLLRIVIWFQYFSIVVVLIRGLGFDIKKFNFVQDLEELNIEVSDEEEVELTLGNADSFLRKIRRNFREFKYYYFENRTFIHIILIVLVVFGGALFFVNREIIHKEYKQNEIVSTDDFTFQVLDTYLTNRGYDNQVISNGDTSFVIVRMKISSNHEKQVFNTSNLILEVNRHSYSSSSRFSARFVDLGTTYNGQQIGSATTYLFIYNIDNEDIDGNMKLVYAGDKTVYLSLIELDKISDTVSLKIGDTIDLSQSSLGSGHFTIQSYEVNEKFSYSYQYEIMGQVNTGEFSITSTQGAILHFVIDSSLPYDFTNYSLLSQYAKLMYKIGDEEYSSYAFTDKTPGNYKEGLYLAVDKNLLNATSIWLDIKIRNHEYLYTIR